MTGGIIARQKQRRFVLLNGLEWHGLYDLQQLMHGSRCIPAGQHVWHSLSQSLEEVLPPRPEVVLQDDRDGPVTGDALDQLEGHPGCQRQRDPGDAEAVEIVQRGAPQPVLAFLLQAIGLHRPPAPSHDRGPGLTFQFVEVVRDACAAVARRGDDRVEGCSAGVG